MNSLGGFLSNDVLSAKIRHRAQPLMKFRQFADAEPAAGKSRGSLVLFDKISNISTQGGTLSETATIPKRNYTITQGTLTVTEAGNLKIAYARLLLEILKPNRLLRLNWGGYCGQSASS